MTEQKTKLQQKIESGGQILLAEVSPASNGDPAAIREVARRYVGKVDALGISDNRDQICMSALAASSLVLAEGVEPILHVVTRDRNRIALISDCLGAQALGIRNVLCTSGVHQTLGRFKAAKNVFDVDSVQLLQIFSNLEVGNPPVVKENELVLGGVAAPFADLMELQLIRLAKKVAAGAKYLITQPVFDVDRFEAWLEQVTARGIHEQAAIVAGIEILADAERAKTYAGRRPSPMIPDALLSRLASASDESTQRAAGIEIAVATIKQLQTLSGLRGFEISGDNDDAVLEVIEKSGLGSA